MGYTVIALFAVFILAMFLGSSSYGPFRLTGQAIIVCFLIGAIFMAYYVPDDPRNVSHMDGGKTVVASADFSVESGVNRGKVDLGGESWRAICESENAPRKGDRLVIERRDGMTLIVRNRAESSR